MFRIKTGLTECTFWKKKDGIVICVLKDEEGGITRAAEMNLKLGIIYDCMGIHELVLNTDNLLR